MAKTNEIVAVIGESEPPQKQQPSPFPNLFSFFPKFNLQLPFLPPKPKPSFGDKTATTTPEQHHNEESSNSNSKRSLVRFPKTQPVAPPSPLQAEADPESSTKTSNPFILWQVYALGGIIISKWIWARWNERHERGKAPNDDRNEERPSDDDGGSQSLDNNE
ncbi:uncharacterized protein LOC130738425 [Lotus japonicus]|uniref:uncharacterized protein LOC130738425 n=1 Tax=Lotus japonicus TaxID=34305 RepID=UPI002584B6CA|nr:uncharacterized protein LOC130738425 [Lotus japonicus]